MGNTCHCVNEKERQMESDLAAGKNDHRMKQEQDYVRDDESNVGDEGFEQEFDREDPELQNAALKIQVQNSDLPCSVNVFETQGIFGA